MIQTPRLPREIRTERLILRPWRPEDAPALYEAVDTSRERVGAWLPWVKFYTDASAAATFLGHAAKQWETGSELPLAIFERGTGRVLGGVGFHSTWPGSPIRWDLGVFETGYWLRDAAEGKGYMREAMRAEMRLVFEHFGAKKLAIRCDARNTASRRVAESMGLRLDVQARNQFLAPSGALRDTLFFSILSHEAAPLIAGWQHEPFEVTWFEQPMPPTAPDDDEAAGAAPDEALAFARPWRIETDRLVLRPPVMADAPALFALVERSRASLERWLRSFQTIHSREDAERSCAEAMADWDARRSFRLLAFERASGDLLGGGELHSVDWRIPSVEIDWWLDAGQTGQGYASEIGAAQLRFVMDEWHANRAEAWCQVENHASRRVAARLGFHEEGILRQEYSSAENALADWAIYSVIPTDYERITPNLPAVSIETA